MFKARTLASLVALFALFALLTLSAPFAIAQECVEILDPEIACVPGAPAGEYTYSFSIFNSTSPAFPIDRIFLWNTTAGVTLTPDEFLPGPIAPSAFAGPFVVSLSGAVPGTVLCFELTVHDSTSGECCGFLICVDVPDCGQEFIRADCNADGSIDISDAIKNLGFLFLGDTILCEDACDFDDNGVINVADVIATLVYIFGTGGPPPPPFPGCGVDPTADPLDCSSFPPCP